MDDETFGLSTCPRPKTAVRRKGAPAAGDRVLFVSEQIVDFQ